MALIIKPSQLEESAKLGAQFRHCIHEEPEIGLYLPKTQEKIVEALRKLCKMLDSSQWPLET